jgi:hypothetical protein
VTFEGEGSKEEIPNGNKEKGCEEESREEKEALTTLAGLEASLIFLQGKLASATSFPEAFCWPRSGDA